MENRAAQFFSALCWAISVIATNISANSTAVANDLMLVSLNTSISAVANMSVQFLDSLLSLGRFRTQPPHLPISLEVTAFSLVPWLAVSSGIIGLSQIASLMYQVYTAGAQGRLHTGTPPVGTGVPLLHSLSGLCLVSLGLSAQSEDIRTSLWEQLMFIALSGQSVLLLRSLPIRFSANYSPITMSTLHNQALPRIMRVLTNHCLKRVTFRLPFKLLEV